MDDICTMPAFLYAVSQDLVAVARPHHIPPGTPTHAGAPLRCRVLDVSKLDNIVYVSLSPALLPIVQPPATAAAAKTGAKKGKATPTGKAAADDEAAGPIMPPPPASGSKTGEGVPLSLKPGQAVEGVVELLKDGPEFTAVLRLTGGEGVVGGASIAHVATTDYNCAAPANVRRQFKLGETVKATLQVCVCV